MKAEDFEEFYREVHGYDPFPWQSNLVNEVLRHGTWPSLLDAPTGLGKTSILDVAVFLLALGAEGDAGQIARRRIFFVVDRRLVVDQAEAHAKKLAVALTTAEPGSISARVADRLRSLNSDPESDALAVVKLRGGVTWESAWLRRPDQPAIVTGTVDQIGSRLLFRGYGASTGRRPIDAALVGTDSLILVDEAHLSSAMLTTVTAAQEFDVSEEMLGLAAPAVVRLSATSTEPTGWTPPFEEEAHLRVPTAKARLTAAKSLELHTTTKQSAAKDMAAAGLHAAKDAGARVLIVCNTVDKARAVHEALKATLPEADHLSLLIGRSRPLDREHVVADALTLFGADREPNDRRAILVATQTVEVGVDLDATALVTELASWDALVQRLGRLNRRGLLPSSMAIAFDDGEDKQSVYGPCATRTGEFLRSLLGADGTVDVSPLALRALSVPSDATLPPTPAALLLPAHLDAWARTSPSPVNDAPIDPYLHGIDGGVAAVTIAWRDGLAQASGERLPAAAAGAQLDALPVRAEECIEVPIGAVRRWLLRERTVPVSDIDLDDDWEIPFGSQPEEQVLRRSQQPDGESRWEWITAAALRPGDTIVAPTSLGGVDAFGWAPGSTDHVMDLAELATLRRGRVALRLDRGLPQRLGLNRSADSLLASVGQWLKTDDADTAASLRDSVVSTVTGWFSEELDRWEPDASNHLKSQLANSSLMPLGASRESGSLLAGIGTYGVILVSPLRKAWQQATDDRPDGTVHLSGRVDLQTHLDAVGARARSIAEALKLPLHLQKAVFDAARWHDLGKVDPRFQAMLFDGDGLLASLAEIPLAKSGMPPQDLARQLRARTKSKMPPRARHEAWSEQLVSAAFAETSGGYDGDAELVLHLIVSHHGHARPLLPLVSDPAGHTLTANIDGVEVNAPLPDGVDLGTADRFMRLNRRYGRWGLALLEAVVRCADMTISQEGS